MKKAILKISMIADILLLFLCDRYAVNGSSEHQTASLTPPYPSPLQSTSQPGNQFVGTNKLFLPMIKRPWEYLPVTAPTNSYSIYVKDFSGDALFHAGCDQGDRDRELPGVQNSLVFIHFGQPYKENNQYGVKLHPPGQFKTMIEISTAVDNYARGYWQCTGIDTGSKVTIAIGVNSDFSITLQNSTYAHGAAWANMVIATDSLIKQHNYDSQVEIAGGSNMELDFDSPYNTINWVNGYDEVVDDPILGPSFLLYSIGDAAGCPPYGQCVTSQYSWTQEEVWYITYGCNSCYSIPMIYYPWTQAEQWQNLSQYSKQAHGYPILFQGTTTQSKACLQRPLDKSCPTNSPEEGYGQLYTLLNSYPDTIIPQTDFKWSTDMKWLGEPDAE